MGSNANLDPSEVTLSGDRCLRELTELAVSAYDHTISPHWVIVSCVASVEAHISRILADLIKTEESTMVLLSKALLDERRDDIFRTWDSRLEWLTKGWGIAVMGDKEIQECKCLVDLRNAILHGGRQLTPLQLKNFKKALELKRQMTRVLNVQFNGTNVIIDQQTGSLAVEICRRAVRHLDKAILSAGLAPAVGG